MLVCRLVDRARIVSGLWGFDIRRSGWMVRRRKGGIGLC